MTSSKTRRRLRNRLNRILIFTNWLNCWSNSKWRKVPCHVLLNLLCLSNNVISYKYGIICSTKWVVFANYGPLKDIFPETAGWNIYTRCNLGDIFMLVAIWGRAKIDTICNLGGGICEKHNLNGNMYTECYEGGISLLRVIRGHLYKVHREREFHTRLPSI